ncbi:MAG: glycosyltransferase [Fusobacteriaceae bacterium]|jgi:GT2 family glycosyltransferase|nr:glycosyltransferase [Fusobacteriaceae bacterium]
MKFCFIILHYKNLKDTLECIDSINNIITRSDYKIIVVDNGSNDASTLHLKNIMIKNFFDIEIIFSKENLGFAKGNNLGSDFAIKKYAPKYLIIINNDTIINDSNFLDKIEESYSESEFDILGPYIEGSDHKPQNPYHVVGLEKKKVIWSIIKNRICILLEIFNLSFFRKIFQKNKELSYDCNNKIFNIPLMGAALIFSKKYYSLYKQVFYPNTFMYCEEDILYFFIKKDKLISFYNPQIKIYHKMESTTIQINGSLKNKNLFKLREKYKSLKILLKLLMKY